VAAFIQGNATLLFKRAPTAAGTSKFSKQHLLTKSASVDSSLLNAGGKLKTLPTSASPVSNKMAPVQDRPLPVPPTGDNMSTKSSEESQYQNEKGWIDDYDYVNLETKESLDKQHEDIKNSLPKQFHKSFENLVKESQIEVDNDLNKLPVDERDGGDKLDANDRQVLKFYASQIDTHLLYLTNAIDAFLLTIQNNQTPKVFVAHSKFVVLSAHKLVYIGDTVHRNVVNADVRNRVLQCANALCDALKHTVQCTKSAALQFPSVIAVQEMVDSVVYISHAASDLKRNIYQATSV
jgi:hypothetical protein